MIGIDQQRILFNAQAAFSLVNADISKGNIFGLEQIKRAAELDIGVNSTDKIKIVGLNAESEAVAGELEQILQDK